MSGNSGSYTSRYTGRLAGGATTLQGVQNWTTPGGPFPRSCSITLQRV
ncbi:hypothetical protein [Muricoccus radiodurans]